MQKTAVLVAIAIAASLPSAAFAKAKKAKAAAAPAPAPVAAPATGSFETLNANGIKFVRDWFMAPQYMATRTTPPK